MPKLSKIRLTGCKYDRMKKEHENSIFDLTKNGDPSHTLFTLFNGGGKGLMMQMIFQLLLPETRWGKSNGNKVISMFYDSRKEFNTFTFHVVLEWVLDTNPRKKLINGIVVKSATKNTASEDDERTGLNYFLYTHEYEGEAYFTVENLPIYNREIEESVDLEEFEKFIDSNRRDFVKYSKSSVSRNDSEYFNYLRSKGIYKSEWINLKKINKSEGGVGDYFSGARGNKSVFDKVIIPAIGENIKNYSYEQNDSLVEMFKSNLSITKDLPVLLEREGDYKNLLLGIKPLINNADTGNRFLKLREQIVDEGNDVYFILKEEDYNNEQEIKKWGDSLANGKEEKSQLYYKKDNLFYNRDKKELISKEKTAEEYQVIIENKSRLLVECEENLLLYKINELIYSKIGAENSVNLKINEKNKIMESLRNSEESKKLETLTVEFEGHWKKSINVWEDISNKYFAYVNYVNETVGKNKNDLRIYRTEVDKLKEKIHKFQLKEESLNKKRDNLSDYYDPISLLYPERILEDISLEKQKNESKINKLLEDIGLIRTEISNKEIEKVKFEIELKSCEKICMDFENSIRDREEKEKKLAKAVCRELLQDYDGSFLDSNWFGAKLLEIESRETEVKTKLEDFQKELWEKNIDKVLNSENHFIPNKDVALIKKEIFKIGIYSETGSEYLNSLESDDRNRILEENPEFFYSIVIKDKKDWKIILNNIGDDLFINNFVPIYIRSEMSDSIKKSTYSIKGKEHELVDAGKYLDWKGNLKSEIDGLENSILNIKDNLKNIESLKNSTNIILESDLSHILIRNLKEEIDRKNNISDEIANTIEKKSILEKNKNSNEESLKLLEKEFKKNNEIMVLVKEYCDFSKEIDAEKILINQVLKEKENLESKILNIEDDSDNLMIEKQNVLDEYNNWNLEVKGIIRNVQRALPKFIYEPIIDKKYSNYKIPEFQLHSDELILTLSEIDILNSGINEKNSKIMKLETEIEYIQKEIGRYEIQLYKLKSNWNECEYLNITLSELELRIEKVKKLIKNYTEELRKENDYLSTLKGQCKLLKSQLKSKENQIEKDHKRPVTDIVDIDIESSLYEVEKDISSNKHFIDSCIYELEDHEKLKIRFEVNLNRIKDSEILNPLKGKIDKFLKEAIKNDPDSVVDQWIRKSENNRKQIANTVDEGERIKLKFIKDINSALEEDRLKVKLMTNMKDVNIFNFKNNLDSFKSMELHFQNELQQLIKDKEKAENAMRQWTKRASIYVLRMIDALNAMVGSMNYINDQGYSFPLVKLKGSERLPKTEDEIIFLLEEHFVSAIAQLLETENDFSNLDDSFLRKLVGDEVIFSKALKGRYPTLLVYKMSENNEFRYARARDEYYDTWEAVNKGEGDSAEGSGGQTLSVNTFVIMMIMSFKKKNIGNEKPSTVLIMDNPFGTASAKHMLDPIFEIADKLNFQLICFSAPEIIKVEISERFPVFWELKVENGKIRYGGRIIRS